MNKEIYLILGASSDIGIELISRLNREKENIIIIAHYYSNNNEINNIICENGNMIISYKANLSLEEDIINIIEYVKNNDLIPTHIVHLPGCKFKYAKLKDFKWDDFILDMNIQVKSLVVILKNLLPYMMKKEKFKNKKVVVMLSSNTISIPPKYTLQYNMIKYALLGVVKSLAADYSGKNININGLSPSMINTKFLSDIDERIIELNAANSVGKEIASVNQIVPVINFLLSQDSNYINGVNINVSNGNIG